MFCLKEGHVINGARIILLKGLIRFYALDFCNNQLRDLYKLGVFYKIVCEDRTKVFCFFGFCFFLILEERST